jgi:hypothetical protein
MNYIIKRKGHFFAKIVFALLFLLSPFISQAVCYQASNFGGSYGGYNGTSANGLYQDIGESTNGKAVFKNENNNYLFYTNYWNDERYVINIVGYQNNPPDAIEYYNLHTGGNPVSGDGWLNNPSGVIAGTLAITDCPSPIPTTTPEILATSTIEQTQTNLFYGFILFFITAFGIISYFSHKFNDRK